MPENIEWEDIEYPSKFSSGMSSIYQGLQQINSDRLKVIEFFVEHGKACKECKKEKQCITMEETKKEIGKRFSEYSDFLKTVTKLADMFSWA